MTDKQLQNRDIHILHIITTIEIGGAENHLLALTGELEALGVKNSVIYLKGLPALKSKLTALGITVIDNIANRNLWAQVRLLLSIVNRGDYDIIHCHLPRATILGRTIFTSIPKLVSFHNAEPFWPKGSRFLSKAVSRYALGGFRHGIAISRTVKSYLEESRELPPNFKVSIIHYGIDVNLTREIANREVFSFKPDRGALRIGTISRLEDQKDLFTLIRGFAKLQKNKKHIDLYLVGTGELFTELSKLANTLRVNRRVHFLGKTDRAASFLSQLDVFTLTSKYEGFGLVLLEAMSLNIPIVASNNSAIPEVLGTDHPGLFKTGDENSLAQKLEFALDENFRVKILKIQQERQKEFSSRKMAVTTLELYQQIILKGQ